MLYPAMEDGVIDIVVGEGPKTRSLRIPIEPLCVVGATTQGDAFGAASFSFRIPNLYTEEDLTIVVRRSAGLELDPATAGAGEIARRSRGTPSTATLFCGECVTSQPLKVTTQSA